MENYSALYDTFLVVMALTAVVVFVALQFFEAGYGYLFWRGANNSYRADGKYGQLSIVFPDRDAVISAVAECRQVEKMMAAIHAHLVPQL